MSAKTEDYGWVAAAPHSSSYINDGILEIVRRHPGRDVLDAGCGNGALAKALADAGYAVVGTDGDDGGIALARQTYPGIRFEQALFDSDPRDLRATPDGLFDQVVSTEVVEHLYDPRELAGYCFRALRPGGVLAMSTPYHGYLRNMALSLADKWDSHHTAHWHGGHIKFWSRRTLATLLVNAGFEVIGFAGVGRLPYLWKSMILVARKPA